LARELGENGQIAPELQRVVTAARACFAERGITDTAMADVAGRTGISRPHLYSFVAGRPGLLELVAMVRLAELGAVLEARAHTLTGDIAEAFVDQIVAGSKLGHDDPEFTALAAAMQRERLNFLLTSRGSALHEINARVFAPLIGRAVAEGRLRPDITTDARTAGGAVRPDHAAGSHSDPCSSGVRTRSASRWIARSART
jgi:AcrR family transcriptional regulator